jgi:hypothetical protein
MPVILVIWEVEISRIMVQGQPFVRFHLNQWLGVVILSSQLCRRQRSGEPLFKANSGKNVCEIPVSTEKSGCGGIYLLS